MADLTPVWLSTITFVVLATVGFIILAEWSAGGAAPWSIAAGVVRGIHDWADGDAEPVRIVSTPATEPQPPIDVAALPLPRLTEIDVRAPTTELDGAQIEDLGTRRI